MGMCAKIFISEVQLQLLVVYMTHTQISEAKVQINNIQGNHASMTAVDTMNKVLNGLVRLGAVTDIFDLNLLTKIFILPNASAAS